MTGNERDKPSERPAANCGDSSSRKEPPGLDERIANVMHLLPRLRSLGPAELRTLAMHLRVLSNVAEGWAQRAEHATWRDDV
jgi:hypothetical protein